MVKITRKQLKEIVREELLREVTIKTRGGLKLELSPVGQKLKIYGFKGNYVELKGRHAIEPFVSALVKNMRIV
jgi:hypothetical protein